MLTQLTSQHCAHPLRTPHFVFSSLQPFSTMTKKTDSLRRFLLTCISPTTTATTTATATAPKKRLSTSLRDEQDQHNDHQEPDSSTTTPEDSININYSSSSAPPRSSKSMVIGTFFGHRRGHLSFSIQHDRLNPKPPLLLHLSIPTYLLVKEMQSGVVRIVLECKSVDEATRSCALQAVPMWTMCVNGRKAGFAARKRASDKDRLVLKTMQSTTVGAGVMPAGLLGSCSEGDVIYMRANYERVVGSADSESFHLISPEACPAQELSVFLLRYPW